MSKKKKREEENDFVFEIEENALSSLSHGIEHFVENKDDDNNLKFAIIHVFHALELFLKARLAKTHPLLIYSKPECTINDDAHTVGFDAVIGRLKNVGVEFSEENIKDLTALRKKRNSIEHHRIHADKEEIKNYIGRAARFLDSFLEEELDITLKEKISENNYRTLVEAIYSYKERLDKAKEEMDNFLPASPKDRMADYEIVSCDNCGEETIVIPDPEKEYMENKAHCFFCGEEFYYEYCSKCGLPIFSNGPLEDDEYNPCPDCWNEIMSSDKY